MENQTLEGGLAAVEQPPELALEPTKDYLNIAKGSDLVGKRCRLLYRLLEILPGAVSLATLFGVVVFSWLIPQWVAIFIICFSFYYLLRILYFSAHQVVGYIRLKKSMQTDWLETLRKTTQSR